MKVKVMQLPKGSDPDSFVTSHGARRFSEELDRAQDLFDYKLNLMLSKFDLSSLEGKARIAGEMLPLIQKVKNTILRSGYIKRLAEALSVSETDLRSELGKVRPDYTHRLRPVPGEPKSEEASMAEKILAGLMLENEDFIKAVREKLTHEDFKDACIRKIVQKLFQFHSVERKITPSKLIDCFKSEQRLCSCISELSATCENLMDKQRSLDDCIEWVRQCGLKARLKALCDQIKAAQDSGDESRLVSLVTQYNEMIKSVKV
jgi:DNA primase